MERLQLDNKSKNKVVKWYLKKVWFTSHVCLMRMNKLSSDQITLLMHSIFKKGENSFETSHSFYIQV